MNSLMPLALPRAGVGENDTQATSSPLKKEREMGGAKKVFLFELFD